VLLFLCALLPAFAAPTLSSVGTTRVQVNLEQASTETPERKKEIAAGALDEIGGAVREVDKLIEQAAKSTEVGAREAELQCLQPKASQLKSLQALASKARGDMGTFLASGDTTHADQQVRRVLVALTRSRELLVEARGCRGGDSVVGNRPDVEVTGSSESLVEVSEEDAYTVEPPQASPN